MGSGLRAPGPEPGARARGPVGRGQCPGPGAGARALGWQGAGYRAGSRMARQVCHSYPQDYIARTTELKPIINGAGPDGAEMEKQARHSHVVVDPSSGSARDIRDAMACINSESASGLYKVLKVEMQRFIGIAGIAHTN